MITRDQIKLKWIHSMGFSDHHHLICRDDELGIQQETITTKRENGEFNKGRVFYFIDDDPREFRDIDDLVEAYNEKFPGDDQTPEFDVQYHAIRIKRKKNASQDPTEVQG